MKGHFRLVAEDLEMNEDRYGKERSVWWKKKRIRVALLAGGRSSEREVSLKGAARG